MLHHFALDKAGIVAGLGTIVVCGCAIVTLQLVIREPLGEPAGS